MSGVVLLCALSLASGCVLGICFALIGLPIPAPPTLPGVLGVAGVFIGYLIASCGGGA